MAKGGEQRQIVTKGTSGNVASALIIPYLSTISPGYPQDSQQHDACRLRRRLGCVQDRAEKSLT